VYGRARHQAERTALRIATAAAAEWMAAAAWRGWRWSLQWNLVGSDLSWDLTAVESSHVMNSREEAVELCLSYFLVIASNVS
jgi:hypothetical protein